MKTTALLLASIALLHAHAATAAILTATTPAQLTASLKSLQSGDVLKIGPGTYPGGHTVSGLENLTVEALDPTSPPVFQGHTNGWQFSRCPGLTLRHLKVTGQTGNGINLDDGGQRTQPVKGITLDHVHVSDIGPKGNHDGVKCSGLIGATLRDCTITGWGGQGIDFVGCHQTLVTGCRLEGKPGFTASAGIQIKGGCSQITVENCRFINAGERPLNIGGSTGLPYFRPPGALHEAKDIIVRGNIIEGSPCSAAFVGVDGAEFTGNTLLFPEKWIFRILQETKEPGFSPCRNARITGNAIVFRRAQVQIEINTSPGTSPETFRFEGNRWFAEDRPTASKPRLPSNEINGTYGVDPR